MEKAIVLLSGGMDSAVTLYIAREEYDCHALIFNYGQKALKETEFAKRTADKAGVPYEVLDISMPWQGSSLLDKDMAIPKNDDSSRDEIPNTYVPARNMIFLSFGVSFAEAVSAKAVFIGAHQMDFSNYPDCRDTFFESFRQVVRKGTREGVGGNHIEIKTPIINRKKDEIIRIGMELGVPFEHTWSCYEGEEIPCGKCESCVFRIEAFERSGIQDPARVSRG
ncbi:MAG: 7-cyano-7-deazaguanine synthase QueC [Candidatus Omnitrophota bacterium]